MTARGQSNFKNYLNNAEKIKEAIDKLNSSTKGVINKKNTHWRKVWKGIKMNSILEKHKSLVKKHQFIENELSEIDVHEKRIILRKTFSILSAYKTNPSAIKMERRLSNYSENCEMYRFKYWN